MTADVLSERFYNRDVVRVAKDLIGCTLWRRSRAGLTTGRIVETEAYLSANDSASHSFKGVGRKNSSMFGPPGHSYVYTIHARQCFNVVTQPEGRGSAVLIRAVAPISGVALMSERRRTEAVRDLCRGPARLCEAFEIGRVFDGWDLTIGKRLWITASTDRPLVKTSVRIGVTSAWDLQLRFFEPDNAFVSGPKWLNSAAD